SLEPTGVSLEWKASEVSTCRQAALEQLCVHEQLGVRRVLMLEGAARNLFPAVFLPEPPGACVPRERAQQRLLRPGGADRTERVIMKHSTHATPPVLGQNLERMQPRRGDHRDPDHPSSLLAHCEAIPRLRKRV